MNHRNRRHRLIAAIGGACITAIALIGCMSADTEPAPSTSMTTALEVAPSRVQWQAFHGVDLPVAQQGPREGGGAAVSGFDRSPAGAALAAIHAAVRISVAPDGQWALIGQRMIAPGPGRDTWASARAQISITSPAAQPPKVLGYTVIRYGPDSAVIDIYSLHADNSLTRHRTRVVWQYEDWRLLLPEHPGEPLVVAVTAPPVNMIALTGR